MDSYKRNTQSDHQLSRLARGHALALFGLLLQLSACGRDALPEEAGGRRASSVSQAGERPFSYAGPVLTALPPLGADAGDEHETERDWAIALGTVEWALRSELDRLPIGEVAAILGTTFVGTPYEPGSLELPGPERLVVNLRAFDCVTLVEHLLVLARITVDGGRELVGSQESFRDRYREELTRLRYRGGVLGGYPSRLHYFSDWIRDGEAKGLLRDLTRELGGVQDMRPIHFMSSNPGSYRQLGEDPTNLAVIRATEAELNALPRHFIPQERIAEIEGQLRNGDVIAAVSTVDGLDIAHTGIALWHGGRVHLLHAPLVGDSVEISERPLAERILGISGQKGIMVARSLDRP